MGDKKNLLPVREIEPRFLRRPARSVYPVKRPTETIYYRAAGHCRYRAANIDLTRDLGLPQRC
jgi:hypothetical protein